MSVVENVIAMVVLMGLFLAAFIVITGLNINFFGETVDYTVKEFNSEKYGNDLDAVLNTSEPVSKDSYANLLADAVYYRKSYFDYNSPPDLNMNEEIEYYYNSSPSPIGDKNFLQVNNLMELTFDKMYGKDNYYLEISPLFVKLRLYFVIDGSTSLENEVVQLKQVIPGIIQDFNDEFEVVARVFVLAGGGLDQLDPCADLQQHADCKYLHKEEMYSDQTGRGWLRKTVNYTGSLTSGSRISYPPSFGGEWIISKDEFLDEANVVPGISAYYCSWVQIDKNSLESFRIKLDFAPGNAMLRVNSRSIDISQSGKETDALADLNAESNWQLICIGYRPSDAESEIFYSYYAKPKGGDERQSYFGLNELFAFRAPPKEYEFSPEIMDLNLGFPGGVFYEDWASASVYAAVTAERENPSTLTVIIPISDELSLGSEAKECEALTGFNKVFCERCNKYIVASQQALECPVQRSGLDVNRAIGIIKTYGYNVFPVLANSCDIASPYTDESNLVCSNFFKPYGDCSAEPMPICGQCFGPNEMECPGLTLENPSAGVFGSKGCDKKQCRSFIEKQMQFFAVETGGKMIALTEIDRLYDEISNAIRDTIEKFKIKAGVKKPEEERFVYMKLVPLSNRLFAELKFWHYKYAEGN